MSMTRSFLRSLVRKSYSSGLDIDGTVGRLKTALSKSWDSQVREFLLSCLTEAEALGLREKPDLSELSRIEGRASSYLGEGLKEAARRPVIEAGHSAYLIGKKAVGIDFSLTQPDTNALAILEDQALSWVRDSYENNISAELNAAIQGYFQQGQTRIELSDNLETLLAEAKRPKMMGYFDLLADHIATRIGEMGHVSGYEEAGIDSVEVVAVLDDRTSDICRHMHGRIIPVSTLVRQRDLLLDAAKRHDFDATKRAQPMLSGAKAMDILSMGRTTDITGSGVALPPYHFRCRTTTVAHFAPADYHERVREWAINGEVPRREQAGLIDFARNARWGTHPVVWHKRYGGDGKEHPTVFVHYKRHASASMEEYNAAAMNLIRGGPRDVYLAIEEKRHPYPVLLFHNPQTREIAIVNVKGQTLASYYIMRSGQWESKFTRREICIKLRGGLRKWIRSELSSTK